VLPLLNRTFAGVAGSEDGVFINLCKKFSSTSSMDDALQVFPSYSAGNPNPPQSYSAGNPNPPQSYSAGNPNPLQSYSAGNPNPPQSYSVRNQNPPQSYIIKCVSSELDLAGW